MTDSLNKIIDQVYYLQYYDSELCLSFVRNSEVADDHFPSRATISHPLKPGSLEKGKRVGEKRSDLFLLFLPFGPSPPPFSPTLDFKDNPINENQ